MEEALKDLWLTDVKDLNHELGRGAYGAVREVSVHRTLCAAKVIHKILLTDTTREGFEQLEKIFIRECLQSSSLRHPNMVQFLGVYDPSESVSLPWMIMEKLHTSLTALLKKYSHDDISFVRKISILQDVSLGIQYLHSMNIVHRDISSNNILLTKDLVAKLSDFGVAKMIDPQSAKTHTKAPGTLIFMPPESTSVKPRYDKPIDIFSLGCVTIHLMSHQWPVPDDQVTRDMRALTEIERRIKYLHTVKIIELKMLVRSCLENTPEKRPKIDDVIQKLQDIVIAKALPVYENVIELEKQLKKQKVGHTVPNKDVVSKTCRKSQSAKLSMKHITTKKIALSKSFSKVMENLKLPGSMFTEGCHFVFSNGGKILVLCDVKKYYNTNGRYVVVFDLQNDMLDIIDMQVRRLCPYKDNFVALEKKSPGNAFYRLDLSECKWIGSLLQPFPTSDIRYPDMLVYSNSLLFVISGNRLHTFAFDLQKWFEFKLVIATNHYSLEASLTTSYAIMNDRLYICYVDKSELYYIDIHEINDAIITQSQPAKDMTLNLTLDLFPVNYITTHQNNLVALFISYEINQDNLETKYIRWAWYYSASFNQWHSITGFDPYIDGQWFIMENEKAAVATLSANWSFWDGWDIAITIHEVQLQLGEE